ncbi:Hypothetical predicted protein [Pelobates cultripes]|uniref:Uncharacterized protein n=1 Tax=Pelobates cultripes TaxID=61616 RepID=A0AAD1RS88_PELCU|nr:Hypothetical predicted protein [Pelobates cultripes]
MFDFSQIGTARMTSFADLSPPTRLTSALQKEATTASKWLNQCFLCLILLHTCYRFAYLPTELLTDFLCTEPLGLILTTLYSRLPDLEQDFTSYYCLSPHTSRNHNPLYPGGTLMLITQCKISSPLIGINNRFFTEVILEG